MYDVEKVVNDKVVKVSKGRATVSSKNSVTDVVTGKDKYIQNACRAARNELHPKTCRQSQPKKIVQYTQGKKPTGTHYTIVARLVKKGSLK